MVLSVWFATYAKRGIVPAVLTTAINVAEALIEPEVAVIRALPIDRLLAKPEPLTVTTDVLDEFQVAEVVRSCVLPSLNVPVAVNWTFAATIMDEFAGVTAIDFKVGVGSGGGGEDVPPPPHPTRLDSRSKRTASKPPKQRAKDGLIFLWVRGGVISQQPSKDNTAQIHTSTIVIVTVSRLSHSEYIAARGLVRGLTLTGGIKFQTRTCR